MMKKKVLVLDRDGVLNHDRPDYVKSLTELIPIPGTAQALAALHQAGVVVVVATNQACIGKGLVTPATLESLHFRLREEAEAAGGRIEAFYVCPHTDGDGCACRKPKPGLLLQAGVDWGFDPGQTYFVGDTERDVQAALAAGMKPALVRTGKGEETIMRLPDIPAFEDLADFVRFFLGGMEN